MIRPTHLCLLAPILSLALAPLACGASKSKPAEQGGAEKAKPAPQPSGEEQAESPETPPEAKEAEPTDPDRLADLDALCAAIDHDYKDGTLGDYYADVKPKTEWGKTVMEAGNEADQPARHLEGELGKISGGADNPALPSCKTLMEYIDDVE